MRFALLLTRRMAVALVLLPILILGLGCPDSDPLDSTTGPLTVVFNPINAAATRYEQVQIRVSQIELRPVDANASLNLGPNNIGTLTFPVERDLARGRSSISVTNLKGGEYRVESLNLQQMVLVDDNPVFPPPDCLGGIINPGPDGIFGTADDTGTIADPRFGSSGGLFELNTFPDDLVTVAPGGGSVTVNIDVPALVAAWEGGYRCFPSTNNVCPGGVPSVNCLQTSGAIIFFDFINFPGAAAAAFTFD